MPDTPDGVNAKRTFRPLDSTATVTVQVARRMAERAGRSVRVEDFIAAMLEYDRDSYLSDLLADFGLSSEGAEAVLLASLQAPENCSAGEVMKRAFAEAERLGDESVSDEHLFAAMVACRSTPLIHLFGSPERADAALSRIHTAQWTDSRDDIS